ncbi:MAG: hypothetical protein IJX62_06925 [Clostridia bacterium]|nr:hypothetical protein [Clostridia bacterium]
MGAVALAAAAPALFEEHFRGNLIEILVKLFQKLAQVEGAKPSSRVATREIIPAFSFDNRSACRSHVRKKETPYGAFRPLRRATKAARLGWAAASGRSQ